MICNYVEIDNIVERFCSFIKQLISLLAANQNVGIMLKSTSGGFGFVCLEIIKHYTIACHNTGQLSKCEEEMIKNIKER